VEHPLRPEEPDGGRGQLRAWPTVADPRSPSRRRPQEPRIKVAKCDLEIGLWRVSFKPLRVNNLRQTGPISATAAEITGYVEIRPYSATTLVSFRVVCSGV